MSIEEKSAISIFFPAATLKYLTYHQLNYTIANPENIAKCMGIYM